MEIDELIRKHAVKNAHDYGKADLKSIVGKIIAEQPDVKKDMKTFMQKAKEICAEVNELSKDEIEKEFSSYEYETKSEKEREWSIQNAITGQVVTRYSPEPNGYMHIGHAKTVFINEIISEKYNGKQILKFDDTNPKTCEQRFVDSIINDCQWLNAKFDKIVFVSDIMDKIIEYGAKLIDEGKAYVCTCDTETIKRNRINSTECSCRKRTVEENGELWNKMNRDIEEGKAIVRFKGNMKSSNTVMRDPAIFRIIDAVHYKLGTKYRVWPTYDFENPISDSVYGVTHVLRSKEFELRAELHNSILRAVNLKPIVYYEYARLSLEGYPVSKRLIRPYVENGFFTGYDDPRLVTIAGLRRRGIPQHAIKAFTLSFGMSKQEVKTDLKKLIAETRKYYDPIAKRYFGVRNPKMITIEGLDSGHVSVKFHPHKNMGSRMMRYSEKLYIDENDYNALRKGDTVRLKDLSNIEIIGNDRARLLADQSIKKDMKKIQWVNADDCIKCELWVLDKPFIDGMPNEKSLLKLNFACEKASTQIKEKEVVQFERVGFCIMDNKRKSIFIKTE